MYHLPAYVALQRWAAGRAVVVVSPTDPEGPRRLARAGARSVRVLGGEAGELARVDDWTEIGDDSIDLVAFIERYGEDPATTRERVLEHVTRVLGPRGLFAAWVPSAVTNGGLDFWAFEDELSHRFAHVSMLAELPWQGVNLAPVLDEPRSRAPVLALEEGLLTGPPEPSHYLALACVGEPPFGFLAAVRDRCLLVPMSTGVAIDDAREIAAPMAEAPEPEAPAPERRPEAAAPEPEPEEGDDDVFGSALLVPDPHVQARLEDAQRNLVLGERRLAQLQHELEEARQDALLMREAAHAAELRLHAQNTDLAVLTHSARDLELSLERANEWAAARTRELEQRTQAHGELRGRFEALAAERTHLGQQLEHVLADREIARQAAARAEAELELLRRQKSKHEQELETRQLDFSRLTAEVEVLRAKLEHAQGLLAQARSREQELSASAAESAEQGRMLSEVAFDRDRLREELTRRSGQIHELEERLWIARDELQRERLDGVRSHAELERLREQAERSLRVEAERARELERQSSELHALELARTQLAAQLKSREDELARLVKQAEALAAESGDEVAGLRRQLAEQSHELAELGRRVEETRVREEEARALAKRREQQLVEIGGELERLRKHADEYAATSSSLQGDLDIKTLEVEQLAAAMANLQHLLEQQRERLTRAEAREQELQRELERVTAEQQSQHRRLREREQELEDLMSAHESSGVEVYKLRRELEAAAETNERLEEALGQAIDERGPPLALRRRVAGEGAEGETTFEAPVPDGSLVMEVKRLRAELAVQTRRHTEDLAKLTVQPGAERDRTRRLQLEIEVRGQEQEQILAQLESAEQRIWEMTDAADRNAARLAAALAQLEKHKEQLDETQDELEVTRKLLAAAQARALEQERLLASERAKVARIGGAPIRAADPMAEVDHVFAELEADNVYAELDVGERRAMVELVPPVSPVSGVPTPLPEGDSSMRTGPRVVVEAIEGEAWPDEGGSTASNERVSSLGPGPVPRHEASSAGRGS